VELPEERVASGRICSPETRARGWRWLTGDRHQRDGVPELLKTANMMTFDAGGIEPIDVHDAKLGCRAVSSGGRGKRR